MDTYDDKLLWVIVIILFILFAYAYNSGKCEFMTSDNTNEHMTNTEAIQNIASIYNTRLARFDNLDISNDIKTSTISTNELKSVANLAVTSPLLINSSLCSNNVCTTPGDLAHLLRSVQMPTIYSSNPADFIIYDNIFTAINSNVISRSGSPAIWDSTQWVAGWRPQGDIINITRPILNIGIGNTTSITPDGISVRVPARMNIIWVRVLNDRWTTLTVRGYPTNTCGWRNLSKMAPDGSEDMGVLHRWVPYPVAMGPATYFITGAGVTHSPASNWISGIGFSTNPYNHAMSSGVAIHWALNGGTGVEWETSAWPGGNPYSDNSARIPLGRSATLMVPVVRSGNDKMLYILSMGRPTDIALIRKCRVTVGGTPVDLFYPHNNVFSRYYNSLPTLSYLCIRIPEQLVTGNMLSVIITNPTSTTNATRCLFS